MTSEQNTTQQSQHDERSCWTKVLDGALFALGLSAMIGGGGYFGWKNQAVEMGIAAAAGLSLMLLSRFHELASVRIGDVELVRRAERVIDDAKVTLEQVKLVGASLGGVTIELAARIGLFGAFPDTKRLSYVREVQRALKAIHVDEDAVAEAMGTLRTMMLMRHAVRVLNTAAKASSGARQKLVERKHAFSRSKQWPNAAGLRVIVEQLAPIADATEEALLDYEHFEQHGELRRPESWDGDDAD